MGAAADHAVVAKAKKKLGRLCLFNSFCWVNKDFINNIFLLLNFIIKTTEHFLIFFCTKYKPSD